MRATQLKWMSILAFVSILASAAAHAQSRSISFTNWQISRDQVTVRVVIPVAEAQRLTAPGLPPPTPGQLAAYMLQHVGAQTQNSACEAIDQGYDIGRVNALFVGTGLYGFEIIFHCPSESHPILKNSVLFDQAPQHVDYARIEVNGEALPWVFTARHQVVDLGSSLKPAGPATYAALGASHVLHSFPRLCFLAGLLLLVRGSRDWLLAATALSCGYLVGLLIQGADLVPQMPSLESAVGLLLALTAAHWVANRTARGNGLGLGVLVSLLLLSLAVARLSSDMAWTLLGAAIFSGGFLVMSSRRPVVAMGALPLLFAALDSEVLSGDYARLQLWQSLGASALLSFNAGALLTDLGIMGLLCGGALWWRRSRQRTVFDGVAAEFGATALAGLGAFWLLIQLKG